MDTNLPIGMTLDLQTASVAATGVIMDAWLKGSRPAKDSNDLTTEQCAINIVTALVSTARRFPLPDELRNQAISSTGQIVAGWLLGRKPVRDDVTTETCTINVLTAMLKHSA
jgi:hypothetical protein